MDPVREILGKTGSLLIMFPTLFENFLHNVGRIREFSIFVGIYPTPSLHMQVDFRIPQGSFKISYIFHKIPEYFWHFLK